jgi:chromosome partitioning protein
MIQTPVIVTFANQKGGVGKTTLCVTFANYLVTKGVRAVVIDCDFQHSIMKCRKADIKKYGENAVPYDVLAYEANDKQAMTVLMEKLHNDPSIDVVLMDSPGSLKAEGLIPMFVNHRRAVPLRPGDRPLHRELPHVHRPPAQGRGRTDESPALHRPQPP